MIQLNLLPDLKKEFINAQKTKHLVISSSIIVTLAAIGISALLFFYVNFGQQFQITLITNSINDKSQELSAVPDVDQYLTIQNQLAALDPLHAEKGIYSRLFSFLNVLNPSPPNNINLGNAQVSTVENAIIFTGNSGSFEALNVFIDTLKNAQVEYKANGEGELVKEAMFSQVLTQSSGLAKANSQTVVSFTVKAIYTPQVFNALNTDVKAIVPNITTTQSVTGAPIPQDKLFNATETE